MELLFNKYQASGNDFVLIDNRSGSFPENTILINTLCDRKYGIGADGLILLNKIDGEEFDFEMKYYNSDGKESTMCGNGGRSIISFANYLGIVDKAATFVAVDGWHKGEIINKEKNNSLIKLQLRNVDQIEEYDNGYIINSGSPHFVKFVENIREVDVYNEGREIRNNEKFGKKGINVDFVQINGDNIFVRTYERGVEAETLSCGTGVTASALATSYKNYFENQNTIEVNTLGGNLSVNFDKIDNSNYRNVFLIGNVSLVFEGKTEI